MSLTAVLSLLIYLLFCPLRMGEDPAQYVAFENRRSCSQPTHALHRVDFLPLLDEGFDPEEKALSFSNVYLGGRASVWQPLHTAYVAATRLCLTFDRLLFLIANG